MSVTGRRPSDFRRAVIVALDGQELRSPNFVVQLHRAANSKDLAIGPREHIDGGFSVQFQGGDTIPGASTPESIGGQVQFKWACRFTVDFAYIVEGIEDAIVDDNELPLAEAMVDLVQLKLNPATGAQWAVQAFRLDPVVRHAVNRSVYVQRIVLSVNDYWRRN